MRYRSRQRSQILIDYFKVFLFWSLFLILFFLSAFRVDTGTDYPNYVNLYRLIGSGDKDWLTIEPGFAILVQFLYGFSEDSRLFFLVTTAVIIGFFFRSFRDYSPYPIFSVFIFVGFYHYFNSLNIIRQYMAMSIVIFLGTRFLIKGNQLKFFASIVLAALFHVSALIFFPLYYVLRKDWSYKVYLISLLLGLSCIFIYPIASSWLFSLLGKYGIYSSTTASSANVFILSSFVLFLIPFLNRSACFAYGRIGVVSFNAVFLSFTFLLLSYYNVIFFRVALYFSMYFVFLFPVIMSLVSGSLNKIILFIAALFILAVNFGYHFIENVGGVYPYLLAL